MEQLELDHPDPRTVVVSDADESRPPVMIEAHNTASGTVNYVFSANPG